jgi:hypothetical protein
MINGQASILPGLTLQSWYKEGGNLNQDAVLAPISIHDQEIFYLTVTCVIPCPGHFDGVK